MAWTRLTAWRQMVAQFFDHPMHLPCLYETDEVVIECATAGRLRPIGDHRCVADGRVAGLQHGLARAR